MCCYSSLVIVFIVKPTSTDDIDVSPYSTSKNAMYTYVPGTMVTLTCKGNVGNPAKSHRWCKKGVNDGGFVVSVHTISSSTIVTLNVIL